jgi:hypothetical protein
MLFEEESEFFSCSFSSSFSSNGSCVSALTGTEALEKVRSFGPDSDSEEAYALEAIEANKKKTTRKHVSDRK